VITWSSLAALAVPRLQPGLIAGLFVAGCRRPATGLPTGHHAASACLLASAKDMARRPWWNRRRRSGAGAFSAPIRRLASSNGQVRATRPRPARRAGRRARPGLGVSPAARACPTRREPGNSLRAEVGSMSPQGLDGAGQRAGLGLRPARSPRKGDLPRRSHAASPGEEAQAFAPHFAAEPERSATSPSLERCSGRRNPGPRRCCRCLLSSSRCGACALEGGHGPAQGRCAPYAAGEPNLGQGLATGGQPGPCLCLDACGCSMPCPAAAAAKIGLRPGPRPGQGWLSSAGRKTSRPPLAQMADPSTSALGHGYGVIAAQVGPVGSGWGPGVIEASSRGPRSAPLSVVAVTRGRRARVGQAEPSVS